MKKTYPQCNTEEPYSTVDNWVFIHTFHKINCGQIVDKNIVDKISVDFVDKKVDKGD